MSISCATSHLNLYRQLIHRHFAQIGRRSDDDHDKLCEFLAIAFRPGNHTASFLGQTQRSLGTATLVALSYDRDDESGRRMIPVAGLRGILAHDGHVTYGGPGNTLFHHDAALRPLPRSRRGALNPQRNPSLTELAQRMDRTCTRQLGRRRWLPVIPQLPRILLGFAPSQPPAYEDTPALRELAAVELDVPVDQLGSNGPMLLDRYLRDLWDRQVLHPGDPTNSTGGLLVNAEYCTQSHKALRIYEDFTHLLGAPSSNPARRVGPLELPNPAKQLLERFGVDHNHNFDQFISDQQLANLEQAMRLAAGSETRLTTDEIYDALTNPDLPLRSWSAVLRQLRAVLEPAIEECTTDDDLMRAARSPEQPLIASGACRIQVLRRVQHSGATQIQFSSSELNRRAAIVVSPSDWLIGSA